MPRSILPETVLTPTFNFDPSTRHLGEQSSIAPDGYTEEHQDRVDLRGLDAHWWLGGQARQPL